MDIMSKQVLIEKAYAKTNKHVVLEPYKDELLAPCIAHVMLWTLKDHQYVTDAGKIREDLMEIVPEVKRMDAGEVCWQILSHVLLNGDTTLQSVMGMFFHQIEIDMPYRKARVLEVFIEAVAQSEYVELLHKGKYLYLCPTKDLVLDTDRYSYVLPSLTYEPVKGNGSAGYETDNFHAITGGKLKQHDGELCLDHIDRVNAVCYQVDTRIQFFMEPEFDGSAKWLNKYHRYETADDIDARRKQFNQWKDELPSRVGLLLDQGNKFFYKHRYDVRGRTYVKAWHLCYISNKYVRALVNTTSAEVVNGADKYL